MELKLLTNLIHTQLDELQAKDIVEIDVKGRTTVADTLIICTGRSLRHVKSIAERLIEKLKHSGHQPLSFSGLANSEWALVDCQDVVVHVMLAEVRAFYNLEGLWQESLKQTPANEN